MASPTALDILNQIDNRVEARTDNLSQALAPDFYSSEPTGFIDAGDYLVIDGDTVEDKRTGKRLRLSGIDTPETSHAPGERSERGGQLQKLALANYLKANQGKIKVEDTGDSTYDRTVARLVNTQDGTDVNALMAREYGADPTMFKGESPYFDEFARRDEMADPASLISPQEKERRLSHAEAVNKANVLPDTSRSTFGAAFDRGTDNTQAMFYKAAEWFGEVADFDALHDWGQEGFERNIMEAAKNPARVQRWDDVDSLADGWTYFVETLGEQAPQLLGDAAIMLAGTAVSGAGGVAAVTASRTARAAAMKALLRKVGPGATDSMVRRFAMMKGAQFGAKAGFVTSTAGQHLGENYAALQEAGVDNPEAAWIPAVINTTLDVYGTKKLFDLIIKKPTSDPSKGFWKTLTDNIVANGGKGLLVEGMTEAMQSIVTESAIKLQKGGHEIDWYDVIDAGLRGAIVGGSLGGAGGVVQTVRGEKAPTEFTPSGEEITRANIDLLVNPDSDYDTDYFHKDDVAFARDQAEKSGISVIFTEQEDGNWQATLDPNKVKETADNQERQQDAGYDENLDDVQGDQVVVARSPDGTLAHVEASSDPTTRAESLAQEVPPDYTVEVMSALDVQRERQAAPVSETTVDQRPGYRVEVEQTQEQEQVSEDERGTASLFVDEENTTLRPREQVLADLTRGKVSFKAVADALRDLGVTTVGTADAEITKSLKIDRVQTARNLKGAGVYVGGAQNRRMSPEDIAASDISDKQLIDIANQYGVFVPLSKDTSTRQSLANIMATLYNTGNQTQKTRPSTPVRESNTEQDRLLREQREREAQAAEQSVMTRFGDASEVALDVAKQWAPVLFRVDAESANTLTDLHDLKLNRKPSSITKEMLSNADLKAAAKELGVPFSDVGYNRRQLILDVQTRIREELRTAQHNRPLLGDSELSDAQFKKAFPWIRQFIFDSAVLSAIGQRYDINAGPAIEQSLRATYDDMVADRKVKVPEAMSFEVYHDVATRMEQEASTNQQMRGDIQSHVATQIDNFANDGTVNAKNLFAKASQAGVIEFTVSVEGKFYDIYETVREKYYGDAQGEKPANATGVSWAPIATDEPATFKRQKQQAAMRGSAIFFDGNEVVHAGAGNLENQRSKLGSATAVSNTQQHKGKNVLFGLISPRMLNVLGSESPRPLTGGYDAISIQALGREYTEEEFGGEWGRMFFAFEAGLNELIAQAEAANAPVTPDRSFLDDSLVIGVDKAGHAVTYGEAREAAQYNLDVNIDLQHWDLDAVRENIETLEADLLVMWEEAGAVIEENTDERKDPKQARFVQVGGTIDPHLSNWFYHALNWPLVNHTSEVVINKEKERAAAYKKAAKATRTLTWLIQARQAAKAAGAWDEAGNRMAIEEVERDSDIVGFDVRNMDNQEVPGKFYQDEGVAVDEEGNEVWERDQRTAAQRDVKTAEQRQVEADAATADRSGAVVESVLDVGDNVRRSNDDGSDYRDQLAQQEREAEQLRADIASRKFNPLPMPQITEALGLENFNPYDSDNVTSVGTGSKTVDAAIFGMITSIRNSLGFTQPLVVLRRRDLNTTKMSAKARQMLSENLAGRDPKAAAYYSAGDYGVIVMPDSGSLVEQVTTFAHELGHAFFETHVPLMSERTETILREAMEQDGATDFSEFMADQFAHWMMDGSVDTPGFEMGRVSSYEVNSLFNRIMRLISRLWLEVQKLLEHRANEDAMAFFDRILMKYRRGERTTRRSLVQDKVHNFDPKREARQLLAKSKGAVFNNRFSGMYRSVVARLNQIDEALRADLYQYSRTAQGTKAWQQISYFLNDRWAGKIEAATKGLGEAQLKRAWDDLRAGRKSPLGQKLRRLIDVMDADMRKRHPYHPREDFVPEAFSHEVIAARRSDFEALILKHFNAEDVNAEQVRIVVDSILYSDGVNDFSVSPGKPVSQHANVDRLLANKAFYKDAIAEGFLLDNPNAILHHYAQTAAKRTAWEEKFGGFVEVEYLDSARLRMLAQAHVDLSTIGSVDEAQKLAESMGLEKDGKLYSPNAKLHEHFDRIRTEKGAEAAIEARKLVRNAMGLDGTSMPNALRNTQNWIMTFLNYTVLAFSGVASIPELAGGAVRGSGRTTFVDMLQVLGEFKENYQQATDLGIVMGDMAELAVMESMGPEYQSPAQHKLNYYLFKFNGQQMLMRAARAISVGLAKRYIARSVQAVKAGDEKGLADLKQLNLSFEDADRWLRAGQQGVISVDQAINQFVYESVVRPSRFEATAWGNNPYMKLAWHLKQFFYSYFNVIIAGTWRAMKGRWDAKRGEGAGVISAAAYSMVPGLMMAALLLPLAMAGQELREWILQKDRTEKMDEAEYARLILSKTGGFGPLEILFNMKQAYDWGRNPLMSATVVTSRLDELLDLGKDGKLSDQEMEKKIRMLIPFFSQNKAAWDALFD